MWKRPWKSTHLNKEENYKAEKSLLELFLTTLAPPSLPEAGEQWNRTKTPLSPLPPCPSLQSGWTLGDWFHQNLSFSLLFPLVPSMVGHIWLEAQDTSPAPTELTGDLQDHSFFSPGALILHMGFHTLEVILSIWPSAWLTDGSC